MSDARASGEWCVVDLETSGLYPSGHDRVIEIGLVVVDGHGEPISEWLSLEIVRRST
jgi:DNA polymerase III epsilon subunit-like protein